MKSLALLHTDAHRLKDIYIYVSPFQCQESSTQERSSSPPIPTVLKRMEVCTIKLEKAVFQCY